MVWGGRMDQRGVTILLVRHRIHDIDIEYVLVPVAITLILRIIQYDGKT